MQFFALPILGWFNAKWRKSVCKMETWDHDRLILRRCVVLMNLKRLLGVGPVVHPNDGPRSLLPRCLDVEELCERIR